MYSHVLSIGGTGMLLEATKVLAGRCRMLTSIARTKQSLRILDEAITNPHCAHRMLPLDWSEPDVFVSAVATHIREIGDPDLVLAWFHKDSLGPRLARVLAPAKTSCAFFQVRGSTAANPSERADLFLQDRGIPATIDYHQIILGFHIGKDGSRWLHDSEISAGVLDAIDHPKGITIVGTVVPWANHP